MRLWAKYYQTASSTTDTVAEDVHLLPVGFDFERLIQPISASDDLPADRVVILYSASGAEDERARKLVHRLVEKLEEDVERVLRLEVERNPVNQDIFDYSNLYEFAYRLIIDELEDGNNVYVNISSMPRTVAFAFATAAGAIVLEDPEIRDSITTYYASPERYLALDMIQQLEKDRDFLQDLQDQDIPGVEERCQEIEELLKKLERGVSEGVKQLNGGLHVEIPTPPIADLSDTEEEILWFLEGHGEVKSRTKLAEQLADELNVESDDSFRSKIQYNTKSLEEKGFVTRREEGNSYPTRLSKIGVLWARTHDPE